MPRLRLLSAGLLTLALAAAACDGAGEHNVPDEANQGAPGADSLAEGTATPIPPPAGTVNPAAASGPGTYADSAPPTAVGQPTDPAAPGGPVPAPTPVEKAGDDGP